MKETLDIARRARLDFIQLHGGQQEDFPSFFPREKLIRTLFPKNYADAEALQKDAVRLAEGCGMFLVDAGLGSGMTPEQTATRMDVPLKYVNACVPHVKKSR